MAKFCSEWDRGPCGVSKHDCESCQKIFANCHGKDITRGSIVYVRELGLAVGSEQHGGRPAVVVSNDIGNFHSPILSVVYLSTKTVKRLPTHTLITSCPRKSVALCETIDTIDLQRVSDYIGDCTEAEMQRIDRALRIALAL